MKKKILFIFLTLIMVIVVLVIYVNRVFFPVQFKQVVIQKAQEFLNRPVQFDSIRFSPIKGIVITNINIAEKNSTDIVFIHIDEIAVSVLYAPILMDKKVIIPQLTIQKPVISLKRSPISEWNFNDLLNAIKKRQEQSSQNQSPSKSSMNFFLGGITIVDGDLTISDKSVAPSFLETFENINLKASLSPQKGIKFSLETDLPQSESTLKIQGDSDLSFQKINANLHTNNIKIAQYLRLYYKSDDFDFTDGTLKTVQIFLERQANMITAQSQIELDNLDIRFQDKEFQGQLKIPQITLDLDLGKTATIKGDIELSSSSVTIGEDRKFQGNLLTKDFHLSWQPQKIELQGSLTLPNANFQLNKEQNLSGQIQVQDILFTLDSDEKIPSSNNLTQPSEATDRSHLLEGKKINLASNVSIRKMVFLINDKQSIHAELSATPLSLAINQKGINIKGNIQMTNADFQIDTEKKLTGNLMATDSSIAIAPRGKIDLTSNLRIDNLLFHLNEQQSLQGQLVLTSLGLNVQNGNITSKGTLELTQAQISLDQNKRILGNVQAQGLEFSLENKKIRLKTNAPLACLDIQAAFGDQQAQGNLKLTGEVFYSLEDPQSLAYRGQVLADIAIISGIPTLNEIKDISGKINFLNDQIHIDNLNLSTFDTVLEVSGSANNFKDLTINIKASTNAFDLSKIGLLAPDLLKKINITPTGQAKITALVQDKIANLTASNLSQAGITAKILLKKTTLSGEKLPQPLTNINGELNYAPNSLSWKNLSVLFGDNDFLSNGQLNNFVNPQIKGTLNSEALGFSLWTEGNLRDKTLTINALQGDYLHSHFDVTGTVLLEDQTPPQLNLKGQVEFDLKDLPLISPQLQKTLALSKPEGIVSWNGSFKGSPTHWKDWETNFIAVSPKIKLQGYEINDLSLKANQANQWVKYFDLSAKVYEGRLKANGALNLTHEEMPYELNLDLKDANLQKFKDATIWKDKEVSGYLSGAVQIKGPLMDWKSMEGNGKVLIHDGNIWQLSLVKGLGKLIFTSDFENIPINEISADFRAKNQKISTENLLLKTPIFNISGKGWVNFENQLDFNLNTEFEERLPSDTGSYQEKITTLITQFGTILNIKLSGALNNPKYVVIPAPGRIIEKGIRLLLEGMKDAI